MALKNFSHMKKGAPSVEAKKEVKNESERIYPEMFFKVDFTERPNNNSKLINSRFCYGCHNFSIDSPGTPEESGWCKRDKQEKNGLIYYDWLPIRANTLVKQCPKVKSGEFIL